MDRSVSTEMVTDGALRYRTYPSTFFCCAMYMSYISWLVVASRGLLSSRKVPVKRGKRMASPDPSLTRPWAQVWMGDRVISAPSTSSTRAGSNHTSASILDSTIG